MQLYNDIGSLKIIMENNNTITGALYVIAVTIAVLCCLSSSKYIIFAIITLKNVVTQIINISVGFRLYKSSYIDSL